MHWRSFLLFDRARPETGSWWPRGSRTGSWWGTGSRGRATTNSQRYRFFRWFIPPFDLRFSYSIFPLTSCFYYLSRGDFFLLRTFQLQEQNHFNLSSMLQRFTALQKILLKIWECGSDLGAVRIRKCVCQDLFTTAEQTGKRNPTVQLFQLIIFRNGKLKILVLFCISQTADPFKVLSVIYKEKPVNIGDNL